MRMMLVPNWDEQDTMIVEGEQQRHVGISGCPKPNGQGIKESEGDWRVIP